MARQPLPVAFKALKLWQISSDGVAVVIVDALFQIASASPYVLRKLPVGRARLISPHSYLIWCATCELYRPHTLSNVLHTSDLDAVRATSPQS